MTRVLHVWIFFRNFDLIFSPSTGISLELGIQLYPGRKHWFAQAEYCMILATYLYFKVNYSDNNKKYQCGIRASKVLSLGCQEQVIRVFNIYPVCILTNTGFSYPKYWLNLSA